MGGVAGDFLLPRSSHHHKTDCVPSELPTDPSACTGGCGSGRHVTPQAHHHTNSPGCNATEVMPCGASSREDTTTSWFRAALDALGGQEQHAVRVCQCVLPEDGHIRSDLVKQDPPAHPYALANACAYQSVTPSGPQPTLPCGIRRLPGVVMLKRRA